MACEKRDCQNDLFLHRADVARSRRTAATIQDLVDRYVADHLPTKSITGARLNDEKRVLAEIAGRLGKHSKVTDIHGGDIEDMHRRITKSGRPVRANRILAVCSKMFSLSLVPLAGETLPWRNAALGNPCKGVARNREEPRERFFSQAELVAISEALAAYNGSAADCVRLIMLTDARPAEAARAQWEEFDNEPGYWIKPSAHVKQRKTHKLPLSPAAIELIESLRKNRRGDWVFPSKRPSEPLTALWHCWHFIRDKAGLGSDARLYDLRHTFASVGAGGGLCLPIIGRLLGHTQARTTQRYAHLADDPLREAATKITAVITGKGKSAPVVPLRDRRS
jgi:integrase